MANKEKPTRKVKKRQVYTENYEVEKIVDKRIMMGQIEYLVKWKGWGIEDNMTHGNRKSILKKSIRS